MGLPQNIHTNGNTEVMQGLTLNALPKSSCMDFQSAKIQKQGKLKNSKMPFTRCFIVEHICVYSISSTKWQHLWNSSCAIWQWWILNPVLSKEQFLCGACKTGAVHKVIFGGKEREHSNLWEHINWLSTVRVKMDFQCWQKMWETLKVVCNGSLFKSFLKGFLYHLLWDYAESVS